jgi:uncharacterized protein YeaO (DUF488 family)
LIRTKRVYAKPSKEDGFRVLVDRLWPRGLTKERAQVDLWMKEIAPSDALRKWFHHQDGNWGVFEKKYKSELAMKKDVLDELRKLKEEHDTVTLLYGSKNENQNQAVVLASLLAVTK